MKIPQSLLALALALVPAVVCHPFTLESLGPKHNFTFTEGALRMNQIQVVGTHNSYHKEPESLKLKIAQKGLIGLKEASQYWYTHPPLDVQLDTQQVRGLELDVFIDDMVGKKSGYGSPALYREAGARGLSGEHKSWEKPGFKVLNRADIDVNTNCVLLKDCLATVSKWVDAHPDAVPIPIILELKVTRDKYKSVRKLWETEDLFTLENLLIRSFGRDKVIVPDDIRQTIPANVDGTVWDHPGFNQTLEESVVGRGWPDLDGARGKVYFIMENSDRINKEGNPRAMYLTGRPSLEGRVMFVTAERGEPCCAVQDIADPQWGEQRNIEQQVKEGYMVRTRADANLEEVVHSCTYLRRSFAFQSGAQIVSTDFQAPGMSSRYGCEYTVRLDGRKQARCNPVNAPELCDDRYGFEPEEYWIGGNADMQL